MVTAGHSKGKSRELFPFTSTFSYPSFVRMCLVWVSKLEKRRVDGSLPARWLEAPVLFYIYATCTSTNLLYITMVRKPLPHAAHELT